MKTPTEYLAIEWKLLTGTELNEIPANKFLRDILEGIHIMISKQLPESHIVAICKKDAVRLRNVMVQMYF
jgi:hypothetical protein